MANPDIGTIVCPTCDWPDAHVRESKHHRAYVLCDECGSQSFARTPKSDQAIRRKMKPAAAPAPAPATEKKPADPAPRRPWLDLTSL